ncbi:MAG: TonB-dependent receptor [Rubrivivax sp.]
MATTPASHLRLIALAAAAAAAGNALAQGTQLQTIEVTAQKRTQNLQVVPVSVEAVTAADLERSGVKDLFNLSELSPSLSSGAANRTLGSRMGLRGISDFARNAGYDSSMGVYIDGVYAGRTEANTQSLFGMERVEVLRGPQGTLFGKNTIAGALNLTTRKPTDRFEASGTADLGGDGQRNLGVWVGMPLGGVVQASLLVSRDQTDGWIDNLTRPELRPGAGQGDNARLLVRVKPSATLSADLALHRYRYEGQPLYGEAVAPSAQANLAPGPYTTSFEYDSREKVQKDGGSVTLNLGLGGGLRLTSITAYQKAYNQYVNDEDLSPADVFMAPDSHTGTRQTSQELRIESAANPRYDWLAGVFWLKQQNDQYATILTGSAFPVAALRNRTSVGQGTLEGVSTAVFAHGNLRLAETLQLTGGLRWTRETKDVVYEQTPIPGVVTNLPRFSAGLADTDVSPKIGLNWFATRAVMVYGSYTRGFKSGGYNMDNITTPVTDPARDLRFNKQTVKGAEIGLKSEFADRRVRLNAAVYSMDGTDWQVQQFVPQANNTSLVTITNAGKVKIDGAEAELQAQALNSLLLKAGVAYTDATFVTFKNGGGAGVDFDGRRLPFAPRIKTTLSAEHALELGSLTLRSSLGYSFTDKQFSNPNNSAPTTIPRYELWNARIALEGGSQTRWSVALWARNLTDRVYTTFNGLNGLTIPRAIYGQPRTFGLTATVDL